MDYLYVETVDVQGVNGPRVSQTGRSYLVMLTSLSARRQESLSNLVRDCTLKVATIGESISEFEVFKRWCVNHCCLLEYYTTMGGVTVLYGDTGFIFNKGSNVAKKIGAWIQKEMRDSQYYGCTVAHKENNVYNIHLKPEGNKTDAMPLSEDSDNRSSGRLPAGSEPVRPGESRSRRSRRSTRSIARWCDGRGCQISTLLNPVQDQSPNMS